MYLIYLNNEYFGHTHARRVANTFRKLDKTTRILHVDEYADNLSFEMTGYLADEYAIQIAVLTDKFGEEHQVITTQDEMFCAHRWIHDLFLAKLASLNPDVPELFERLPPRLIAKLGDYYPVDVRFDSVNDDLSDLTFEGFVMFRTRKECDWYQTEEDIRVLQEIPPWV